MNFKKSVYDDSTTPPSLFSILSLVLSLVNFTLKYAPTPPATLPPTPHSHTDSLATWRYSQGFFFFSFSLLSIEIQHIVCAAFGCRLYSGIEEEQM